MYTFFLVSASLAYHSLASATQKNQDDYNAVAALLLANPSMKQKRVLARTESGLSTKHSSGTISPWISSRRNAITAALAILAAPAQPVWADSEPLDIAGKLSSLFAPPPVEKVQPKVTSRCYMDISIGDKPAERIEIDLYGEAAPKAAENFRVLCTGEKGYGYAGSSFYKVAKDVAISGGDVDGDGKGRSIYGEPFEPDNYSIKHDQLGLVSMVREQRDLSGVGKSEANDSRFVIQTIDDATFLDNKYEAFGQVTSGLDVLQRINLVSVVRPKNSPKEPIRIVKAGQIAG